MNRLAIFVEGHTEQLFADKLVNEVAGKKNVLIERRKISGGRTVRRHMELLQAVDTNSGQQYYVLIVDCGNDEAVKSRIREEYDNLAQKGYQVIIGLRDVYPKVERAKIGELRMGLPRFVKTKPVPVVFVLGIMEIEAWFLAEHTHFELLDTRLTPALIKGQFGFDPSVEDMEMRDKPAEDMDMIYSLVGKRYQKDHTRLQRTVDLLDYARLYLDLSLRYTDLGVLVACIDKFLTLGYVR